MSEEYQRSRRGFQEIANSPEIHAALEAVAKVAKTYAEGLAQDFRRTGDYADNFQIVPLTVMWEGRFAGPRAAVRLENTSDHAAAVEWGNRHDDQPHRTLGRTLDALRTL